MDTFIARFCAVHGCAPAEASDRLFRNSLYPHARLIAFVTGGLRSHYFAPERELLEALAHVKSSQQLSDEIRDYISNPANRSWWRRTARIRLSTQRLRRLMGAHRFRGKF